MKKLLLALFLIAAVAGLSFAQQNVSAPQKFALVIGNGSTGNYTYAGSNTPDSVAWHSGNSGNSTKPVGTKAPNGLGLHDMSGNVWEWCWDWKGSYSGSSQTDPAGPASGDYRVVRGGGWYNGASSARSVFRYFDYPHKLGVYFFIFLTFFPKNACKMIICAIYSMGTRPQFVPKERYGKQQRKSHPVRVGTLPF